MKEKAQLTGGLGRIFALVLIGVFLILSSHAWAISRNEDTGQDAKPKIIPGRVIVKASSDIFAEIQEAFASGAPSINPDILKHNAVLRIVGPHMKPKPLSRGQIKHVFKMMSKIDSPETTTDKKQLEHLTEKLAGYSVIKIPDFAEYSDDPVSETLDIIRQLRAEGVEAEPDYEVSAAWTPDDPYMLPSAGSWGQDSYDLWGLERLQCEDAWDLSTGKEVVVAVIDAGVDYTHPELAGKVISGPDYVDDDADPMDCYGHGTLVAGTISAIANNGLGIAGVAPDSEILAIRALNCSGSGSLSDVAQGISYAADNGASVINLSLGSSIPIDQVPGYLSDALAYAHAAGVVIVAAAGNSNRDVKDSSPANDPHCIAVSAFDHTDSKADFSNYGTGISLAAPGGGDSDPSGVIYDPHRSVLTLLSSTVSSSITGNGELIVGDNYVRQAGTSMAAPHVAGVAALVRVLHPEFSPEQVRQAMENGSDDVSSQGFDIYSGYGRVNAYGALTQDAPIGVLITSPLGSFKGNTFLPVKGMVEGPNLVEWTLAYGRKPSLLPPTTWTDIAHGTSGVHDGELAMLDLKTLPHGDIVLRLQARNSLGEIFEDTQDIFVDQIYLTYPAPTGNISIASGIFPGNPVIEIEGTVAPPNLERYEFVVYGSDSSLINADITLTNGGTSIVRDDVLGVWDTAGLSGDRYTVYLNVYTTDGSVTQERVDVIVDPALHEGWPISPGGSPTSEWGLALLDHTTIADVNGDGLPEIILGYGQNVHVKSHDGTDLPGWPQPLVPENPEWPTNYYNTQTSPAVGDLDGDGEPEIVAVNNYDWIFIWHADGTYMDGWPRKGGDDRIAIADMDGDGKNELINQGVRIWALDLEGNQLWCCTEPYSWSLSAPAIGDVDGDGTKEIAVYKPGATGGLWEVYLLDFHGEPMPGWPVEVDTDGRYTTATEFYPVLGDINNDGNLEIVVSLGSVMYAFDHEGNILNGWPQTIQPCYANVPGLGDVNGDGSLEVIVGTRPSFERVDNRLDLVSYLYAFAGNGSSLPGWPVRWVWPNGQWSFLHDGFMAPAIADVDGDGLNDIIFSGGVAERVPGALSAFRYDGIEIEGFSRPTMGPSSWPTNTAAIADMDGDGLIEVVLGDSSRTFYMWDYDAPATTSDTSWPMYLHDPHHTGAVAPDNAPPVISDLAVAEVTGESATISWTTSVPANSRITYGFSPDELIYSSADGGLTTSHSITLDNLPPDTTIYYRVCSVNAVGLSHVSGIMSLITSGESPVIRVRVTTDRDGVKTGIPVSAFDSDGAKVGESVTTNKLGIALFDASLFTEGDPTFCATYFGYDFCSNAVTPPSDGFIDIRIAEQTATILLTTGGSPRPWAEICLCNPEGVCLDVCKTTDKRGEVSFTLPVGKDYMFRASLFDSLLFSASITIEADSPNHVEIEAFTSLSVIAEKQYGLPMEEVALSLHRVGEGEEDRPIPGFSTPNPVARTGQTTSFKPGDDGALQKGTPWPNPRFTDNNDGTVTDNLTGLVWLKDLSELGSGTWYDALTACNNLASGANGLADSSVAGDWRLPNLHELESLLDYGYQRPVLSNTTGQDKWLNGDPFVGVIIGADYWTSTTHAQTTSHAWSINLRTGSPDYYSSKEDTDIFYWPMRDGQQNGPAPVIETGQTISYAQRDDGDLEKGKASTTPRFTDNGDGTVTDYLTGLVWLKDAGACGSMTWVDALNTCNNLASGDMGLTDGSVAGDWRLPSLRELQSLVDYGRASPAVPVENPFISIAGSISQYYWTSNTAFYMSDYAWILSFGNAGKYGGIGNDSTSPLVWPVRDNKNLRARTGESGTATFHVFPGTYKICADYLGYELCSEDILLNANTEIVLSIPNRDVTITVSTHYNGDIQPKANVIMYLFSPDGSYLGISAVTDEAGQATFRVPPADFKVRADYLSQQYWTDVFNWEDRTITIEEDIAQVHVTCAGSALEGLDVFVSTVTDDTLAMIGTTDARGIIEFRLPGGVYEFAVDAAGYKDAVIRSVTVGGLNAFYINIPTDPPHIWAPVPVVRSGQKTSYAVGDDGDLEKGEAWPNPRFTDNADGTITDNLTGLVWLKDPSSLRYKTWSKALDACNGLADGACGLTDGSVAGDWRLPNRNEIETLVDFAYGSPALSDTSGTEHWSDGDAFASIYRYGYYFWTSTTYPGYLNPAWLLNLNEGTLYPYYKIYSATAWPVRDGRQDALAPPAKTGQIISYEPGDDGDLQKGVAWPNPRFVDNGDGTVTDNMTGLVWLKDTLSLGSMTWSDALETCNTLGDGMNGLTDESSAGDWRLPNVREIQSLFDYGESNPAVLHENPFGGPRNSIYWTSTTRANEAANAFYVSLSSGETGNSSGDKNRTRYLWPVRGPVNVSQPPVADAGPDQTVSLGETVTLDGSTSSDPDENYPLRYAWTMISQPEQSTVTLDGVNTPSPTFTPDVPGDYEVELVVTDSLDLTSTPDRVLIHVQNSVPVADAGEDQAIIEINTLVQLRSLSYDLNGDAITCAWAIIERPAGSAAELSDPASAAPTFVADVHGDYVIELVVHDVWGASSADTVTVSFNNVTPVADAGGNQSVVQGDLVYLDGGASSDANKDPLTYAWTMVSKPEGSLAELNNAESVRPTFTADLPGEYTLRLVVNDGFASSEPSPISVIAITKQDAAMQKLMAAQDIINILDENMLKNKNLKKPLTQKIKAVLKQVDKGEYQDALDKLEHDILDKMNGCAETGKPDKNDWITDCSGQDLVYPLIMYAIDQLKGLVKAHRGRALRRTVVERKEQLLTMLRIRWSLSFEYTWWYG